MVKILICEDNEIDMKFIQLALKGENIRAVYATDGREAVKQLNENNDFDLIITDIHMPYHNGDEILRLVRERYKNDIPVIMISSDDDEEVVRLALKLGVNEFIKKPVDPAKVKKKIKKYLR